MPRSARLFLLACATVLGACSSSLIYAPGAHVQSRTPSSTASLSAGVGMLPNTQPEAAQTNLSEAGEAKAAFQFSEVVRMEGNYFLNLRTLDGSPDQGFGLSAWLCLSRTNAVDWMLSVRTQFLLAADDIEGYGMSAQFGPRFMLSDKVHSYAIIGPMTGWRDVNESEYGYGALTNVGIGFTFVDWLSATIDIAGIGAYDAHASTSRFAVSPSLQLTFNIPTSN